MSTISSPSAPRAKHPNSKARTGYNPNDLSKKATNRIAIDAAQQYFINATPVADTVQSCRDIDKFIDYFKASKGYRIVDDVGGDYGGLARWYIGTGGVHLDKLKLADGKRIQLVERGAVMVPDLPDAFPDDVDYDHYIRLATKLITDITEPPVRIAHNIPLTELSRPQREQHQLNYDVTNADLSRCAEIDLTRYHADYAAVIRGNRYDTMKALAVRLWLSHKGALTQGDLLWAMQEVDAADGYFKGRERRTLTRMVEWVAREISPIPIATDDRRTRRSGDGLGAEHVEPLQKKRKTLPHRDVLDSAFVSGPSTAQI